MMNPNFWKFSIVYKTNIYTKFYDDTTELNKFLKDNTFLDKIKGIYFVCCDIRGKVVNEFFLEPPFWVFTRFYFKPFNKGINKFYDVVIKKDDKQIILSYTGKVEVSKCQQ